MRLLILLFLAVSLQAQDSTLSFETKGSVGLMPYGFQPNQILHITQGSDSLYEWRVSWEVVNILFIPCPDKESISEYGIKPNYTTSCAVLHTKSEVESHIKDFRTELEADEFIKNMPINNGWVLDSYCRNPVKEKL